MVQRYLSDSVSAFVSALVSLLPAPLSVVYLVNSGSEANDLALRLARQARLGRRGVVVLSGAYHGHTAATVDCSPYKFQQQAAQPYQPQHVRVAAAPDLLRWRRSRSQQQQQHRQQPQRPAHEQPLKPHQDEQDEPHDGESEEREAAAHFAADVARQLDGRTGESHQATRAALLWPPPDRQLTADVTVCWRRCCAAVVL